MAFAHVKADLTSIGFNNDLVNHFPNNTALKVLVGISLFYQPLKVLSECEEILEIDDHFLRRSLLLGHYKCPLVAALGLLKLRELLNERLRIDRDWQKGNAFCQYLDLLCRKVELLLEAALRVDQF